MLGHDEVFASTAKGIMQRLQIFLKPGIVLISVGEDDRPLAEEGQEACSHTRNPAYPKQE